MQETLKAKEEERDSICQLLDGSAQKTRAASDSSYAAGGEPLGRLGSTNNHARDVVMLGSNTDEFVEVSHDVRERQSGSFPACDLDNRQEASLSEFVALLVSGFRHAVGVDHQ